MRQTKDPSMSGALVGQHLTILGERYPKGRDDALSELSAEQRQELSHVLAVDWVRVSSLDALYLAVAQQLGRSVVDLHWEIGKESVERTFRTIWRLLIRFTTDEALVARTPVFHQKTFNVGRLASQVVAPGKATIDLTEWPDAPEFVRRGIRIGVTTVLGIAGRQGVAVADERRRDGAHFDVSWELEG